MFVGCETAEGHEPAGVIVGIDHLGQGAIGPAELLLLFEVGMCHLVMGTEKVGGAI